MSITENHDFFPQEKTYAVRLRLKIRAGLALSTTYDIVAKIHRDELKIETKEGEHLRLKSAMAGLGPFMLHWSEGRLRRRLAPGFG